MMNPGTTLSVKYIILLCTFASLCSSLCEIYFQTEEEIVCITRENVNTSIYESVYDKLRTNCHGYQANHRNFPRQRHLVSVDCNLTSHAFSGISAADVRTFRTGDRNPSPILPNYLFSGICKAHTVILMSSNIETVEPNAFDCAKDIRLLELSNNRIEDLPPTIFKEMQELTHLNLSTNRIKTLHAGFFDEAKNLQYIDLSSNSLTELPDGIFQGLPGLKGILLANNSLVNLGRYPFSNLTQLVGLSLRYNNLKSLEGLFRNNHQLISVFLADNEIESVSKNVFMEARNLRIIIMFNNRLGKITREMFGALPHLMYLDLANNDIREIQDHPFLNNNFLTYLNLQGNKLTEVSSNSFKGLLSLDTLILDSNYIADIENGALEHMPSLRNLKMGSNLLSSLHTPALHQGVFSNSKVQQLDLADNKLTNLSSAFHNTSITHLFLNKNKGLILSSDTFAGLVHLDTLHLKKCNIATLPDGIFANTPQLRFLILHDNRIQSISAKTFAPLSISVLDLSYNRLENLANGTFAKNRGLLFLNVSHNSIYEVESEAFRGLERPLQELDVNSNFLRSFTLNVPDLFLLNISYNSITSLDGIFAGTEKLVFLDIARNNLTDITIEHWKRIFHLKIFNASHNNIREVYVTEVSDVDSLPTIQLQHNKVDKIHLPNKIKDQIGEGYIFKKRTLDPSILLKLYLSDNPITCDCFAYKVYEYVINFNRSKHYVSFEDDLICHQPLSFKGRKLRDLAPTDMTCNYVDDCSYFQCLPKAYDCIDNCSCTYQPHGEIRGVNCSNKGFHCLPRHIPKYTNLLDLSDNEISTVMELNQSLWENLTEINLESNAIDSSEFQFPTGVTFLGLKRNKLTNFPISIQVQADRREDFKVSLSENLWACDCTAVPLKDFLLAHENKVTDIVDVLCNFPSGLGANMSEMTYANLCPSLIETVIPVVVYVIVGVIILASFAMSVFYYKYKLYVLSFLYTYCNGFYKVFCCDREIEEEKIFDGFISYGSDDRDVALAILEELEQKPPKYSFCIHERNWMPGSLIIKNIEYSVKNSRKTLIVLSESFLKSPWFYKEFQAAYNRTLQDKQERLILILKGKLPDLSELHEDVRYVLTTVTYLEWGERWFFEKLRYAMHLQKPFVSQKKPGFFSSILGFLRSKQEAPQQDIEL